MHDDRRVEDQDLDAFLSESGPVPEFKAPPQKQARGQSRLLPLVAALAVIEAVPAGFWLHQAFVVSEARAADAMPTPEPVPPTLAVTPPCEPPGRAVDPTPSVASQGRDRTAPAATAGAVSPSTRKPNTPPGSVGGLVAVVAPVPMRIVARGRIVGTTEAETVMLPVGTHQLDFVNDDVGYAARRTVTVEAGRTATIRLEAPSGTVHVNATPWAELWVDNHKVGDTPIGNLRVPIGTREFVFKHPELGERRRTALVTLKEPLRITMDLRTK